MCALLPPRAGRLIAAATTDTASDVESSEDSDDDDDKAAEVRSRSSRIARNLSRCAVPNAQAWRDEDLEALMEPDDSDDECVVPSYVCMCVCAYIADSRLCRHAADEDDALAVLGRDKAGMVRC